MKRVLVDSSIWIEYFKGSKEVTFIDELVDLNVICTNDLVLSELIPSLLQRKEMDLISILRSIERINLEIDWDEIIKMQVLNLKNGINKVGIADLIIVQNTMKNDLELCSRDKHFLLMNKVMKFKIFR